MRYLGQPHRTAGNLAGLPSKKKLLASLVALLLSAGAFALAAEEAQAEEQPLIKQTTQQSTTEGGVVINGQLAEPAAPGMTSPEESSPSGTPPAETLSPSVDPAPSSTKVVQPQPAPTPELSYRYELLAPSAVDEATPPPPVVATTYTHNTPPSTIEPGGTTDDVVAVRLSNTTGTAPGAAPEPESTPTPAKTTAAPPASSPQRTPEPIGFEEIVSADAVVPSVALPAQSGDDPAVGAPPIGPSPSATDPQPWGSTPSVLTSVEEAVSLAPTVLGTALSRAAGTVRGAADFVFGALLGGAASTEPSTSSSSSGWLGDPRRDSEPQPLAPFAPPPFGDSFFSLWAGGSSQAGATGAPMLFLMGVLASVLVLLRANGRIWQVFCEVPKPSSALLSPLERPG